MTDPLQQLMTVRDLRERKAQNRVARGKARLEQARAEKGRRTEELVAFQNWRLEEERRQVAALTGQTASVQDLLCFRSRIDGLRADQAARAHRVAEAADQVHAAEADLQTARRAHTKAFRQREKIRSQRERWQAKERREMERAAENELDACGRAVHGRRQGRV
ncbi:MAG: YscO family type III secretion system apparatus protein [Desulfosarcinaceae bacterium]|jgi:hypothetical protein